MKIAVVMPQLGLTMEEGTVSGWLKKTGDAVKKDEALFSVSTDKVEMDVESGVNGALGEIVVAAGETVRVGTLVAYVVGVGENVAAAANQAPAKISEDSSARDGATAPRPEPASTSNQKTFENLPERRRAASPRAKRLAKELGIDLSGVHGSGLDGQITEQDVRKVSAPREKASQANRGPRQLIADRLTRSIQTIPTFSVAAEVNAEKLLSLHESLKESLAGTSGLKLTITDLLLAMFGRILKGSPDINALWEDNTARAQTSADIGLAVATARGVVAPVIRNADAVGLPALVATRAGLVEKARMGRLSLQEMEGGVGTLSNLGMYRVDHFQAIISPGQSSILAVGQIRKRPWVEGTLTIKPTVMLNLTVDHRVADGAAAAVFLGKLIELIENPQVLSLKAIAPSGDGAGRKPDA